MKGPKKLGRDARNTSPCPLIDGVLPPVPSSCVSGFRPPHELVISVNDPDNTLKALSSCSQCQRPAALLSWLLFANTRWSDLILSARILRLKLDPWQERRVRTDVRLDSRFKKGNPLLLVKISTLPCLLVWFVGKSFRKTWKAIHSYLVK